MQIVKLTKTNHNDIITRAQAVLAAGGLVVFPSETCYGIGADATNTDAIAKLLQYKKKRANKPFSIAVADAAMAAEYVQVNQVARNIYDNFLPGPITVVSKSKGKVAAKIESPQQTVGVRIPDYKFLTDLAKSYGKPFTATSANASNKKTPYTIQDIFDNISEKQKSLIDLVIDAGTLLKRPPSTVVNTTLDSVYIHRQGAINLTNATKLVLKSETDTKVLVQNFIAKFKNFWGTKLVVFELEGDLGVGKTHFTKYLAAELGVTQTVVSPTFVLCREYNGQWQDKSLRLYHLDTYRLQSAEEMSMLRPQEIFASPNVVVIEWANKVDQYIQPYLKDAAVVKLKLKHKGKSEREVEYVVIMNS